MVRCVRVPKREGEQVRSALFAEGMLDLGARIRAEGDFLLIPVLCESYGDYEVVDADMAVQEQRPTDYREVADVPEDLREHLPSSFDVVGDVAMIKLPDELKPYATQIGEALLSVNHSIRIVFEDHGVKGEFSRPRVLQPSPEQREVPHSAPREGRRDGHRHVRRGRPVRNRHVPSGKTEGRVFDRPQPRCGALREDER